MWKAACDLLYSELNGSEYDNNSRIQSCPVAEHSLWDRRAEISKKKIVASVGVMFGSEIVEGCPDI